MAAPVKWCAMRCAIWKNESENGPFHSVTFARTFTNGKDELQDSDSFSGSQLLRLARLAEKAYDRSAKLTRAAREADETDEEGEA